MRGKSSGLKKPTVCLMYHKLGFLSVHPKTLLATWLMSMVFVVSENHNRTFLTSHSTSNCKKRFKDLLKTHGLNLMDLRLPLFYMVINSDSTISETFSCVQEFSEWTEIPPRWQIRKAFKPWEIKIIGVNCKIKRTDNLFNEVPLSIYIYHPMMFSLLYNQMIIMSVYHNAKCWWPLQRTYTHSIFTCSCISFFNPTT